jgi:hypothetical protein
VDEERVLYLGLIAIGGPPLVIALARGNAVGAGPTLAGLLVLAGLAGLYFRADRGLVPRAASRKRRP